MRWRIDTRDQRYATGLGESRDDRDETFHCQKCYGDDDDDITTMMDNSLHEI